MNENYLYNGLNSIDFYGFELNYEHNRRDSRVYPLKGFIFDINIKQRGGIVPSNSNFSMTRFIQNFVWYTELKPRVHYSNKWSFQELFTTPESFFFDRGLGYSTTLRGFEYYILHGNAFAVAQQNFKYTLIPQKNFDLTRLHSPKISKARIALYSNIFFIYCFQIDCSIYKLFHVTRVR